MFTFLKSIIINVLINIICDKAAYVLQTVTFLGIPKNVAVSFNI